MEEWRPIKGFEGLYEVSNLGRVRSVPHIRIFTYRDKGKMLKPLPRKYTENITYSQVNLYKDRKHNVKHIHRLVAEAFLDNPEIKPMVNHKDGDGTNNQLSNLEWNTQSENTIHAWRVLKRPHPMKGRSGATHPTARAVLQLSKDGKILKRYGCIQDVKKDGFDSTCVVRTCQGENGQHKGYRWTYA